MEKLIIGLILHFVGDYLLQNDWMAQEKTKQHKAAFIHAFIYSIGFYFLVGFLGWLVIFFTHFLIDRYRLATYWIKLVNWNWQSTNFGFDNNKPLWMSVWLMIIIDNVWHILINTVVIYITLKL